MNLVSKLVVVIVALMINYFLFYVFQEVIDFEKETQDYVTIPAVYNGENVRACLPTGCTYKNVYNYVVNGETYTIHTARQTSEMIPPIGSMKLVKYDPNNPNLAFFTKMNVIYLLYLIEFVLLFVVLWVCFSRPKEVKVVIDENGEEVKMESASTSFYIGQAIISAIFTIVCIGFFINMASNFHTFNPIQVVKLTYPAGIVLVVLTVLGLLMTILSYKRR